MGHPLGNLGFRDQSALGAPSRFAREGPNAFRLRQPNDPIPPLAGPSSGIAAAWMFQGNPARYDLLGGVAAGSLTVARSRPAGAGLR